MQVAVIHRFNKDRNVMMPRLATLESWKKVNRITVK